MRAPGLKTLAVCVLFVSCHVPTNPDPDLDPRLLPKPRPALGSPAGPSDAPPHIVPFLKLGCVREASSPDRGTVLDCRQVAGFQTYGCVADLLVIDQAYAPLRDSIGECLEQKSGDEKSYGADSVKLDLGRRGCMFSHPRRFLIVRDGRLFSVQTAREVAEALRPIETPAQAQALAALVTGAVPREALPPRHVLIAAKFAPTYVSPAGDGFDVRLFKTQFCGCGPHHTAAQLVHVTREGTVLLRAEEDVYRDSSKACID